MITRNNAQIGLLSGFLKIPDPPRTAVSTTANLIAADGGKYAQAKDGR